MSVADRRERDSKMRQDSIIDAAEKLFFAKGFGATTIDEIAEAAELSKGAIYLYFKNKEEIYVAIARRATRLLIETLRDFSAKATTGRDKLRALGQAMLTFYRSHPDHFKAMFYQNQSASRPFPEIDRADPLVRTLVRDKKEIFALSLDLVNSGIADGTFRAGADPVKTTLILMSMILGLIRMACVDERFLSEEFGLTGEDLIKEAFDSFGSSPAPGPRPDGPEGA